MFDLGKGDKEKLEENMEEIKQLVNEGQNQEGDQNDELKEISQQVTGQNQQSQEENDNEEVNIEQDNLSGNGNIDNSQIEEMELDQQRDLDNSRNNTASGGVEDQKENELDRKFEEMQNEIAQEIDSLEKTQEQHESQRSHTKNNNQSKESQAPTTENNIGTEDNTEPVEDGQKSEDEENQELTELNMNDNSGSSAAEPVKEQPLFLEVEKFEDIKKMVEEMHYLTTEMDDVMQHLESGIQDDRETMDEADQIVEEFQARRDRIQQTLRNN